MEISVRISYKNEKLQNVRQEAGMSQAQLARAAGISVRVLQDYERGARYKRGKAGNVPGSLQRSSM